MLLAGCYAGNATPGSPSSGTAERSQVKPLYGVIYSFAGGGSDGSYPSANLLGVNGVLYGTTQSGGPNYKGTIFSFKTSGGETLLHSFPQQSDDGYSPYAGLTDVGGTLYGTTADGGANGFGMIFKNSTSTGFAILSSFTGHNGAMPKAPLLNVGGTLYGTASEGGLNRCNCGTVFKVTASGTITVLHKFDDSTGGGSPSAGLINVKGTLYGTAALGGRHKEGTAFAMTTSGKETVLHAFGSSNDGAQPEAGLLNVKGTLYGTTSGGGTYGLGTVFTLTTSGKEAVIHNFGAPGDGADPTSPLINVNGTLYGTTSGGGAYSANCHSGGCGTVFAITTSGKETVLHNFEGYVHYDGSNPQAGLRYINGTLYGTTVYGGDFGDGTIFSLAP